MAQTLAVSPATSAATRQCLLTRATAAKEDLWRFVLDPNGILTFDCNQRLPGRGVWLTPQRAVLEEVIRKNLFAKGFKAPVIVPADIIACMQQKCLARVLSSLSLARKAGQAVAGTQKVTDFIRSNPNALVMLAGDAGTSTLAEWRSHAVLYAEGLTAAELGSIFSRDIAVVIAVAQGNLCSILQRAYHHGRALQPQPEKIG